MNSKFLPAISSVYLLILMNNTFIVDFLKEFEMIRYLLIMLMFLFIISCSDNQDPSGGSSLQAGVAGTKTEMQQPTVQVGPTLNITVKIPAAMWVGGFVENQITVG